MAIFRKKDNWYIDYWHDGRRIREKIGPSKKLALDVERKRKIQIAEGKFLDKKDKVDISFNEMAELYLTNHAKVSKMSWQQDIYQLNAQLLPFFGKYKLSQITPLDIERFKAKRFKEGKSPQTVKHSVNLISIIINKAIKWQKFKGINPVAATERIRVDSCRTRFLSKDEIDRLFKACDSDQLFSKYCPMSSRERVFARQELKNIVVLAIHTGFRLSELARLTWNDVDMKQKLLHVIKGKSKTSIRAVPMTRLVEETLSSMLKKKKARTERLFLTDRNDLYKKVVCIAKLEDVNFHTLRHTFASHFMMRGGQLLTLSKLLGHSSIKVTMRYAHLAPDHIAKEIHLMDNAWTPN